MKSRVHPRYKTEYRVRNWSVYDRALIRRGDVTVWISPEATDAWAAPRRRTRGGQHRYSDVAIEVALTLRLVFRLPLRQTEGFLTALFTMMGAKLSAPDHTTLSRRSQGLRPILRAIPQNAAVHLIIDSTGLSIVGAGEWAALKHGRHSVRGWRKLHLGVNEAGLIVAQVLTDAKVDDAKTGVQFIEAVPQTVTRVTGDGASDTVAVYEAAVSRGAQVVVPPAKVARVINRRGRSPVRDATIERIRRIGRRAWKKETRYHQQSRVENAFSRYKSIIGGGLRARSPAGQAVESRIACNVLNRMTALGRPESYPVRR